jgi:hypothetical protein
VAARLILPANARDGLVVMRVAWSAAELVVLALIVAQAGRIRRRMRALRVAGAAPMDALEEALAPSIGALPARLIATELGVVGFAFGGFGRATPPEDARTFSMHRRAHSALTAGVFLFLMAAESALLHFVIARGSPLAAWLVTASSLWAAVWLIGDVHAMRLQPLRLTAGGLAANVGIRWRTLVPYDAIASVTRDEGGARTPSTLAATVLRSADVRITLRRPLTARGLFGRTRRFDTLLLTVDRPDELIDQLLSCRKLSGDR